MAYKKRVVGRTYPFLYNVTNSVGAFKSLKKETVDNSSEEWTYDQQGNETSHQVVHREPFQQISIQSKYQANKRDDVMLVQYLLKRIYQQGHNARPPLNAGGDPHSPAKLKIDGIYGPKTQHAIEKFQLEMRRNGQNIATDGCVDSEKGNSTTASISKTGYTISWLNKYFWVLYPTLAQNISVDPECPMELKQAVSKGW